MTTIIKTTAEVVFRVFTMVAVLVIVTTRVLARIATWMLLLSASFAVGFFWYRNRSNRCRI